MNQEIIQTLADIRRTVTTMMKSVWNVSDLALVLGISESRVRHMAAEHVIPSYKQNGSLYFKREEIEAWLTRNRTPSNAEIASEAATRCATRRISR